MQNRTNQKAKSIRKHYVVQAAERARQSETTKGPEERHNDAQLRKIGA